MANTVQDYRGSNNIKADNEILKSAITLDDKTLQHIASLSMTANNNDDDKNFFNDSDSDSDDNDSSNDNDDDDNKEPKTYNNLDLTRQVLQKVREYMKAEKMSMSEFARQTGVSKAWLSKLKHTDANLSLNTAQDLLHYMGYTLRLTREGSAMISKSRIRKYACKNLMDENVQSYILSFDKNITDKNSELTKQTEEQQIQRIAENQQTKYVTAKGQQTKYVVGENQQIQRIADSQQIAPTPSSVQQTQTSTITNSVSPSNSTPAPVKLSPGQTVTISANKKVKNTNITSTDEEMNNLSNLDQQFGVKNTMTKQQKTANHKINNLDNNILNNNEINLLYNEDFFSTPLGSLNKK